MSQSSLCCSVHSCLAQQGRSKSPPHPVTYRPPLPDKQSRGPPPTSSAGGEQLGEARGPFGPSLPYSPWSWERMAWAWASWADTTGPLSPSPPNRNGQTWTEYSLLSFTFRKTLQNTVSYTINIESIQHKKQYLEYVISNYIVFSILLNTTKQQYALPKGSLQSYNTLYCTILEIISKSNLKSILWIFN